MILYGNRTKCITGADLVILCLGKFRGTRRSLLFTEFLLRRTCGIHGRVLFHDEIILLIIGREVLAAGIQEPLLQDEETMTQSAGLEVNDPLGVESETAVPCLEMEMGAGRSAGRTAETYLLACRNPVTDIDKTLRKMGVESLEPVLVTNDDKIAETLVIP